MCGIAGIYNFETREPVSESLLKEMTDTLIHRGPDDEGFYVSGPLGLGHRRLSIIDLAGGHQPIANEDGTIWAAFNGEIYNFPSIRERLIAKGHVFKTRSDTEVIVHLYEEKGEECIRELNGMFSIALWDENRRRLILARDRVGKKPLFYLHDGKRVVFASEMKAILKVPGVSREIDPEALTDYFSYLYVPVPKSIFKAVRKVRPGHYLVVGEDDFREVRYWDLSFAETHSLSEEQWIERTLTAYREAVKDRLISDVPLGAFLSGGVDSSSTVALMAELSREPVVTSSIGFGEREYNEVDFARKVAQSFQTDHHEEIVRPDAVRIVEKLAWHYDEPYADSSAIPTYYVSKVTRQNVKVALSGDGGDEVFAGYRRYYMDRRENMLRSLLPSFVRRPLFGTLAALYPKADWAPRVFRGKATATSLACSHIEGYFRSISGFHPPLKQQLLSDDVNRCLNGYHPFNVLQEHYARADTSDPLSRIQYVDIKTYLTDDILVKVDRASMANSLEVRAPLLDHRLMEMAACLPTRFKMRGRNGKYILKKAFESKLPPDILYRKKMGFAVPLSTWFRKDLKEMAHDLLFSDDASPLLNQTTVRKIWNEHQRGFRERSSELWMVLMFRLWERVFLSSA